MRSNRTLTGGLYGKLPTYGDFLHRRLPTGFVEAWNDWLSPALAASRSTLNEGWMEAYLTSPPWRFVLDPGLIGDDAWLGVVASSVDRVRRCYPMTVAMGLPPGARLSTLTCEINSVFDAIERIVLQMIDGTWTPDAVMSGIDKLADVLPVAAAPNIILSRGVSEWLMFGSGPLPIASLAADFERTTADHRSYPLTGWWTRGWNGLPPAGLVSFGLPGPELFVCMLDGNWAGRGWTQGLDGVAHE